MERLFTDKTNTKYYSIDNSGNTILDSRKLSELADEYDSELLELLYKDEKYKKLFFFEKNGFIGFKADEFKFYVGSKNIYANSFTKYSKKIGLASTGGFLKESGRVVLDFPFKDCVLEGGQTKDEQSREEIMFNSILESDQIDVLLAPKAFNNVAKYSVKDGKVVEEPSSKFSEKDNLLIKGNNLIALHSLKERFAGKVKLIYIDPPYNTENDKSFCYNDKFNHSTWLTFMKNRLEVAKDLLRDDGVIFVQCDDNEQAYLKVLMDEIFDKENFLGNITWLKGTTQNSGDKLQKNHEYILTYAKKEMGIYSKKVEKTYTIYNKSDRKYYEVGRLTMSGGLLLVDRPTLGYSVYYNESTGDCMPINDINEDKIGTSNDVEEVYVTRTDLVSQGYVPIRPSKNGVELTCWSWGIDKFISDKENILIKKSKGDYSVNIIKFLNTSEESKIHTTDKGKMLYTTIVENLNKSIIEGISSSKGTNELKKIFGGKKVFSNPKSEALLQHLMEISTKPGDLVLDFFAGSGTTASVAHKMGRQWITIEQMDYIKDITRVRLQKVLEGEQGGISKAVEWKGGGEFTYMELYPLNQAYIDVINKATSDEELVTIKNKMIEDRGIFVDYRIHLNDFKKDEAFRALTLQEKQTVLVSALDKNNLYLDYANMEDPLYFDNKNDVPYSMTESDKKFTDSFYNKGE